MWQYLVPASMLALLLVGGCAKTTVMQQQSYEGPRLAKPARILVYDFAAHASDLPAGYATAVAAPPADQSSDDLSLGRELGALVLSESFKRWGCPPCEPKVSCRRS